MSQEFLKLLENETFWKVVAAFAGAIAVIIGAFIAYAGVRAANALKKLEQDTKNRELLKSSLEFLTGGTQKRTVGIALLKDRVDDGMISKNTASTILEAQLKHLQDDNNADGKRPIEIYNAEIISKLLVKWNNASGK